MYEQNYGPSTAKQDGASLFSVSFFGPDQNLYQVSARVKRPQPRFSPQPELRIDKHKKLMPNDLPDEHGSPFMLQPMSYDVWQSTQGNDELRHRRLAKAAATHPELHTAWDTAASSTLAQGQPDAFMSEQVQQAAYNQPEEKNEQSFLLQIVQPGLVGLMDGSVSTLAPIFSVAFATHQPFTAFLVGLASALGAGISMAFAEAISDDGDLTGRGSPLIRGGVTGLMTFLSGLGHALPFLVPNLQVALFLAYVVVAVELIVIAGIRHKFFHTKWWLSVVQVVGGGALVFLVALLLGNA